MPDSIQNALTLLRNGDKVNGKKSLLEILNDDPENDQAWVLMTAVVDTEELQQECLEKALAINPNNRVAQKRLKKLLQSMDSTFETSIFADQIPISDPKPTEKASVPTLSKNSQETIEYLSKRILIEKFYDVLALDELLTVPILNPNHFSSPIPASMIYEMQLLQPYFNVILFGGGTQLTIICLKVCRQKNEPPPITQAQLVEIGRECLPYSGQVRGQTMPVKIQIWELFERSFTPDDARRLRSLKRIPGTKKVAVQTCGIDQLSKKVVYSSAWFEFIGTPNYIQGLLDEESTFSEQETIAAIAASANKFMETTPIIIGVVTGLVMALTTRFVTWDLLGWTYEMVIDIFFAIIVISIAVYLPRFKTNSQTQGLISAMAFGIILYGIDILFIGFIPSIWHLIYIIIMIVLGNYMGKIVDP